jgi:tellurite resistance protein TerB
MLNWLKENTANARARLRDEVTKYKNRDFMEAVVAGCAIVAAADGTVSSAEKQKMIGYMRNSEELRVFDIEAVIKSFGSYVDKFEFDAEIGRGEALRAISRIRGKTGADRLLVRVCCAIGAADGTFDANEKAAVTLICLELGLDPKDFDL